MSAKNKELLGDKTAANETQMYVEREDLETVMAHIDENYEVKHVVKEEDGSVLGHVVYREDEGVAEVLEPTYADEEGVFFDVHRYEQEGSEIRQSTRMSPNADKDEYGLKEVVDRLEEEGVSVGFDAKGSLGRNSVSVTGEPVENMDNVELGDYEINERMENSLNRAAKRLGIDQVGQEQ